MVRGAIGAAWYEAAEGCVLNSLASGRRIALHIVVLQLAVALLAGLAFALYSPRAGLAAALAALLVALGTWLMSARVFSGLYGAPMVLARLVAGVMLKWFVVLGGMGVILFQYRLPPLAAVTGLMAACAGHWLAIRFKG